MRRSVFRGLIFLAVPLAAFITFLVQPVVGKVLMPRYGGSAGTWMTVSLFFQAALLAGYALAYGVVRQSRARSRGIVAVLALAGPLLTRLPPWYFAGWPEWPAILFGLTLSLLPALLLTTSLGIVLQEWIRASGQTIPYYLYGVSNLGSALALILYPFWIEPRVGLSAQIMVLRGLLGVLGVVTVTLVWIRDWPLASTTEPLADRDEKIPGTRVVLWSALAFGSCTLMLGAIRVLTVELGSNPVAWLLPLGVYLLSFTATFSGWWRKWMTRVALGLILVVFLGYMATKGISDRMLTLWPRTYLIFLVGLSCLGGHGLLHELRPARRFSFYYLIIALAGLLAGIFASVGAPNLFDRNYELVGGALLLTVLIAFHEGPRRWPLVRIALPLVLALPILLLGFSDLRTERSQPAKLTRHRNYYGTIVLAETPEFISASNETTLHGLQLRDERLRRVPTTYYARGTGVGMVLSGLQRKQSSLRIGVVGLGVGTLATYIRQADTLTFWEINPLALKTAREQFSFLRDCFGRVEVKMIDGRIGIRAEAERFDLLVIDAFNGDAVPVHLITAEAIREYIDKLGDGLLLVHISNRFVDLFPVLAADAERVGWKALTIAEAPSHNLAQAQHVSSSRYALLFSPSRDPEVTSWLAEAQRRVDYEYRITSASETTRVEWTDNLNSIDDLLVSHFGR